MRKNLELMWVIANYVPRPAILVVTCCFAPHLLSHIAPPSWSRDHCRRAIHWFDRDRGIVYSRQKSRDKASLFSVVRSGSVRWVTLSLLRVIRDRRRRSPSLLGEPVSVDRSIVEATTSEIPSEFSNCRSSLCDKMKAFVHIALVAACLIACAYALPSKWHFFLRFDFFFSFCFFCKIVRLECPNYGTRLFWKFLD